MSAGRRCNHYMLHAALRADRISNTHKFVPFVLFHNLHIKPSKRLKKNCNIHNHQNTALTKKVSFCIGDEIAVTTCLSCAFVRGLSQVSGVRICNATISGYFHFHSDNSTCKPVVCLLAEHKSICCNSNLKTRLHTLQNEPHFI